MKICMIIMTEFVNDARVTREINALVNSGYDVDVFALKNRDTSKYEKKNGYCIFRISVKLRYILPKKHIFYFLKYVEFVLRVVIKAGRERYSLFHSHDLETLPVGWMLSLIHKKPLLYDSHELYIDMAKHKGAARRIWSLIEKALAKKTDANILTTESRAQIFAKRYVTKKPFVIKNVQYLTPRIKSDKIQSMLKLPKSERVLLYQGAITRSRGIDVLIDTMRYIDNCVLVIMGYGNYKNEAVKKIRNAGLDSKINIIDAVPWEELAEYTASAYIGISLVQNDCLNNYTMLSNKLFEYLNAGLPVIFPEFPEWKKLILTYKVGFVVNEKDPKTVAHAVNRILKSEKLHRELSENARRVVENEYNWGIEEKKLLAIYSSLLEK